MIYSGSISLIRLLFTTIQIHKARVCKSVLDGYTPIYKSLKISKKSWRKFRLARWMGSSCPLRGLRNRKVNFCVITPVSHLKHTQYAYIGQTIILKYFYLSQAATELI